MSDNTQKILSFIKITLFEPRKYDIDEYYPYSAILEGDRKVSKAELDSAINEFEKVKNKMVEDH